MHVDLVAIYLEVKSFQNGDINLMGLLPLSILRVYNQMIEKDKGENTSNYVFIPLMVKAYKFHIGCLNEESHNKRMIYVSNDVVTEGNTLLSDNDIEMHVSFTLICNSLS